MFTFDKSIEDDINNLIYYYAKKKRLDALAHSEEVLYDRMTDIYNKIYAIHEEQKKVNNLLDKEKNGYYTEVYDIYKDEQGRFCSRIINKKIKDGKVENLKEFISEDNEHTAINKYLKTKGVKISYDEVINIDELLGLEEGDN